MPDISEKSRLHASLEQCLSLVRGTQAAVRTLWPCVTCHGRQHPCQLVWQVDEIRSY